MKNVIYIVTGAAGFLGSHVCRQLVKKGNCVRGFTLPGDKGIQYLPKEVEVFEGNLTDINSIKPLFIADVNKKFIVIHCASIVTVSPEYNQMVMDVNVEGTKNIIRLCKSSSQFQKLVYISSTGCIPEKPKGEKIKEIKEFATENLMDCYSQSKALATNEVLKAAKEGLDACVIHPGGILGPEDYALGHTTKVLIQIIKGEMSAAIAGTFNLCDVRDLASGIISATENGKKGECYILANEAVSFKEFARIISEESGCKRMRFFLPGKIAFALAERMERKVRKHNEKPKMTTYAVYNLIRNNEFDNGKAKKELGYITRSFRQTIKDEINWLKKEKLIP